MFLKQFYKSKTSSVIELWILSIKKMLAEICMIKIGQIESYSHFKDQKKN